MQRARGWRQRGGRDGDGVGDHDGDDNDSHAHDHDGNNFDASIHTNWNALKLKTLKLKHTVLKKEMQRARG